MRRHISAKIARSVIFPGTFRWARWAGLVSPGQHLTIEPVDPVQLSLRPAAAVAALTLPAIAVSTQGHGGALPATHARTVTTRTAPAPNAWLVKAEVEAHATAAATLGSYTVRPGDTLSGISAKLFGSAGHWPALWWANRHAIPNPDLITSGMVLTVGSSEMTTAMATAAYSALPKPVIHVAATVSHASTGGKVYGVTYGDPNYCGDGDGDGWDVACQAAPAPAQAAPAQAPAQGNVAPFGSSFQQCVITRESGGNPGAVNPASGAGGLYQFLPSTWAGLGYPGLPENAPVWEQNQAFYKLYAEAGTSPWAPSDGC